MTDEQRIDSLECYGSRWGRSPNIDMIARRGITFAACTTPSPSCVPANGALFTGRFAHACNCLNPSPSNPALAGETSLVHAFSAAGYQTANLGKCDYLNRTGTGFEILDHGPSYGGAVASPTGLDPKYDPKDYDVITFPNEDHAPPTLRNVIIGGCHPLPKEEAEPGWVARRCATYLAKEAARPFFLRASFCAPHTPVLASRPFYGTTDPATIDLPLGTTEELKSQPRFEQFGPGRLWCFHKLSRADAMRARANYYDLCMQVDDAVGQILRALQDHELDEQTIVVFNSDHGALLGEHGLGQKRNFYDPVIQVPFIFSWPGMLPEGRTSTDPAQLHDLLPTLMGLVGIDIPTRVQAQDLAPQLRGERSVPDRATFSEVQTYGPCSSHRAIVRHGQWKLGVSLYDAGYGEDGSLYDLERDPGELRNLYTDPASAPIGAELKERITAWQTATS